MAKKSFFERLTGATKEELFEDQLKDKAAPIKKIDFEKPQKTFSETKTTIKKTPHIMNLSTDKISQEEIEQRKVEIMEDKKEWSKNKEGQ